MRSGDFKTHFFLHAILPVTLYSHRWNNWELGDRYFAMIEFHGEDKEIEILKRKEMFLFLFEGKESA